MLKIIRPKKRKLTAGQTRAKVRHLALQIKNQRHLDDVLLPIADVRARRAMYDYMRPMLTFASVFPSTLILGELNLNA